MKTIFSLIVSLLLAGAVPAYSTAAEPSSTAESKQSTPKSSLTDADCKEAVNSWMPQHGGSLVELVHPYCRYESVEITAVLPLADGRNRVKSFVHFKGRILGGKKIAVVDFTIHPNGAVEEFIWGQDNNEFSPKYRSGFGDFVVEKGIKILVFRMTAGKGS